MTGETTQRRKIAYVFPIFNEEGNIELLYRTMCTVTDERRDDYDFEFIFVDDGSTDGSSEMLHALRRSDKRISIYTFARNYGHQIAVTAGTDMAEADAVIIMDSDLQDPPSVSLELIERWEAGADVVYAQRRSRRDTFFKRSSAHLYYWMLSKLASIDIPRNTGDFRLMDRQIVLELRKYREHNRFIRGLVSYIGFRQDVVQFDRDARHAGSTGYPLRKMLRLAGDGIFGFSTIPLQLISRLGLLLALLASLYTVYLVIVRIVSPEATVEGWTFVVVTMFMLGGIQLIMLGVLGNYVGRIYIETQDRPLYAFAHVASEGPRDFRAGLAHTIPPAARTISAEPRARQTRPSERSAEEDRGAETDLGVPRRESFPHAP